MPFLIDKETAITTAFIGEVINKFKTSYLPKLNKYYNYYMGNQEILRKPSPADWKPCNRIVSNYPAYITDSYTGYLTGIDITYTSDEDIEDIQNILNYNDVQYEDATMLKNALIFGKSFELMYIDEDGKQRFRELDPRECIDIYYNDLGQDLAAVIRWYASDNISISPSYYVELYTQSAVFVYKSDSSLASFQLVEERPNYYNQVPITIFKLNEEEISIFDRIIGLQDAYNTLLSSSIDDWEAFCDCYLTLTGMDTDEETVKMMKQNRVMVMPEGGSASFLTKNVQTQQIESLLDRIDEKIHTIANCPDFSKAEFGTASGIAMRYKLLGFENTASAIEKRMMMALQRRIELICSILYLTGGEDMWRDVQILFTRNLPTDVNETITEVNALRGLVSDKTLLAQLPFITDVDAELEAVQEQKQANMELYNFGSEVEDDDEE
jgi:SPP1 family phage portal protein